MKTRFFLVLIIVFSVNGVLLSQSGWKLDKDEDEVRVYTRSTPRTSFKEFKAETIVKAPIEKIEYLLDRFEVFPEWQANMDSVALLEVPDDSSRILYFQSGLPWPISDRDFIFKQIKHNDAVNNTLTYQNICMPYRLPEYRGFIRIQVAQGYWRISRKGDITEIIYQWAGDPEGSIPGWLVNTFIVDGPHETLSNLRGLLNE